MTIFQTRLKIGILGCGAIGSRIAKSVTNELKTECQLAGLFDIDRAKLKQLTAELKRTNIAKPTLKALIQSCDFVVEAVNAPVIHEIVEQTLKARKSILVMSVGKLLNAKTLFNLARKNKCHILFPSGAIAGLDAVKAASLGKIESVTLTTRKSPAGFRNNAYLIKKKIDLTKIKKETVLFQGSVDRAVRIFPQNINVAAALALASRFKNVLIRIIASPKFTRNSHEIDVRGDFGRIHTWTDNVVCPDNPKTSYLAVLSGIQTLKQFASGVFIGT